jgi:hypothetical protein
MLTLESLWIFFASLAFFAALERLIWVLGIFKKDFTGRYFILHVLCNGAVTFLELRSMLFCYYRPDIAIMQPMDTMGTQIIAALHIYHCLSAVFKPLPMVMNI